jgi:hypothetical protein
MRPRWGLNPGLTDRLIVGRNVKEKEEGKEGNCNEFVM